MHMGRACGWVDGMGQWTARELHLGLGPGPGLGQSCNLFMLVEPVPVTELCEQLIPALP